MSESKTLPVLIREASEIASLLSETDGEITPEIEALIDQSGVDLAVKMDSYFFVMQELDARAESAKARADEWYAAQKACERAVENMKTRLLIGMKALDLPEMSGAEVTFRRQANPPKAFIENETMLPGNYIVTETTTRVDRKQVLEDLKAGKIVPGAHIERGERIVAKVGKGAKVKKVSA